ncbi:MAG: hypothetical protein ABSF35_03835 [Polyangia bacterium]|jgi:hypothetical protein
MSNITPEVEALVRNFAGRLIAAIEADVTRRLQAVLASALGTPAPSAAAPRESMGKSSPVARPVRRAKKVSRALVQARKLQGRYLGALRGLKPADRARVKAAAHEKGLLTAIELAHSIKR